MKLMRSTVLIAVTAALTLGVTSCAGTRGMRSSPPDIQGTWQLTWPPMDPKFRELKHITPTHFTWITYDVESHELVAGGGGPYFLVGDTYNERIDFAHGLASELVGTLQTFRVTVQGDTLLQTGTMTNGGELRELWVRAPK